MTWVEAAPVLGVMSAILPQGLIHTTRPQFDAVDDADCSLTNSQILNQFWKGQFSSLGKVHYDQLES